MQVKIVKKIYKRLLSLLDRNLRFEMQSNSKYTKHDVLEPLIRAQAENTTINSACRRLGKMSSDDVFYHLKKVPVRDVMDFLSDCLQDTFTRVRKENRITGEADIAVDVHKIAYYGKDQNIFILGDEHKDGTSKFYKVITLCIVSKGKRYTLAAIPMCFFDITVNLLEQLVETARKYVKIRYAFLDRGFLSVDIVNKLYDLGLRFIIPIKRNSKIVKLMISCFLNGADRIKYTMKSNGKEASFDLVVHETKDDLVGFATSIPGKSKNIAKLYRKRWGIETSYRVKNNFFGKTCSRKPAIRLLFILLSFLIYNLWVLANRLSGKNSPITAGDMCIEFVRLIENGVP